MKGSRTTVVAIAAVAAVALASIAAIGTGAGAESTVRGVTSTEIKVSGLGSAASFSPAGQAAKARFDEANVNGEIPGGRTITYIGFADDGASLDTNAQRGRSLVDQDGVFAVVPVISSTLGAAPYLQQQKVPTLGWGISSAFCDPSIKYLFGFTGCVVPPTPQAYVGNTWGDLISRQLEAQGKVSALGKTAAILAENSDSGRAAVAAAGGTAASVGMKVVYSQATVPPPPAAVSDYSPYVQALMGSNGGQPPDVVFLLLSRDNALGLGRALGKAGFKGIQTNDVTYASQLAAVTTGFSVLTQSATPESTVPNMTKIVATLNKAGIETKDIGQPALAGYFAADMFVGILKKVGKKLTPEAFQKAASKFTYELESVIGPTAYPAGFQVSTPCGQLVTSDGTKWAVTAPFGCSDLLKLQKNGTYKAVPYPAGVTTRK